MSGAIAFRPAFHDRVETRAAGVSFVATKTITVRNEYGQDETLKAGVTFVHDARHFLVTEYPHLFVREGARTRAKAAPRKLTAARTASPTAPAKPPMWKPLVRLDTGAAPTFTVRVAERAYLSMGDQAFSRNGTAETGGALFGIPGDGTLKIRRAGSPGPKARASESRMHVDCDHVRREAVELERNGGLDRWVGSWHTHPTRNSQPSDSDLQFFAWDAREWHHMGRSIDNYVGLILTPNWQGGYDHRHLSWAKPTIHAWHMQAVSEDQFICARAEVVRC